MKTIYLMMAFSFLLFPGDGFARRRAKVKKEYYLVCKCGEISNIAGFEASSSGWSAVRSSRHPNLFLGYNQVVISHQSVMDPGKASSGEVAETYTMAQAQKTAREISSTLPCKSYPAPQKNQILKEDVPKTEIKNELDFLSNKFIFTEDGKFEKLSLLTKEPPAPVESEKVKECTAVFFPRGKPEKWKAFSLENPGDEEEAQ